MSTTIDRLFPARLSWRQLYYKMMYYHVPWTDDKYSLLEQCRKEAVDLGEAEMLKDEWWNEAIHQQKEWDELADKAPHLYAVEMKQWNNNCIEAEIAHQKAECMIRHRSDKNYDIYDSALRALKLYHVENDPYWLAYIEIEKEAELVMRAKEQNNTFDIQAIIDSTREDYP